MTTEKPGQPSGADAETPERAATDAGWPGRTAADAARPDRAEADAERPELTAADVRWARVERKQARIRAEIERNRAGDHKVPTWALAALLGLVILAWVILVIAS